MPTFFDFDADFNNITITGARANKIFVAPAPQKYLKRLQLWLLQNWLAPCSGSPDLVTTRERWEVKQFY